jgi:putative iron-regulated protein
MTVAYEARSQEDEHSCFSDNTTNDIIGNASGIEMVYLGAVGSVDGPGVYDLVAAEDQELADRLRDEIAESIVLAEAIPAPFDQHLAEGVSDDDPGRVAILDTIVALETQADSIVDAASILGVEINLS